MLHVSSLVYGRWGGKTKDEQCHFFCHFFRRPLIHTCKRKVIDDDMKGLEKSMTVSLAAVTVRSAAMRSISFLINIPTNPCKIIFKKLCFLRKNSPFQDPLRVSMPYLLSTLATNSKLKFESLDVSDTRSTMNPSTSSPTTLRNGSD